MAQMTRIVWTGIISNPPPHYDVSIRTRWVDLHFQKMEVIGTLAGGIAHDFNNILEGILGFTDLATMKLPEQSKVAGDLEQVMKAGNRAKALVKQILAVSRRHKQERKPLDTSPLLREALRLLRARLLVNRPN